MEGGSWFYRELYKRCLSEWNDDIEDAWEYAESSRKILKKLRKYEDTTRACWSCNMPVYPIEEHNKATEKYNRCSHCDSVLCCKQIKSCIKTQTEKMVKCLDCKAKRCTLCTSSCSVCKKYACFNCRFFCDCANCRANDDGDILCSGCVMKCSQCSLVYSNRCTNDCQHASLQTTTPILRHT